MFLPHSALAPLTIFLALWPPPFAQAVPRNVSFDDSAAEIVYTGPWDRLPDGTSGFHHVTSSSAAFATFRFRGTALYFMSPKWSYPVGTDLSLSPMRNSGAISLDLQDYGATVGSDAATQESTVVASYSDLQGDIEYELRVSHGSRLPFAVVDEIIITIDDEDEPSSSVASNPSSPSSPVTTVTVRTTAPATTESSKESRQTGGLPVATIAAIGAVGGAAALVIIILLLCYIRRRKGRRLTKNDPQRPLPSTAPQVAGQFISHPQYQYSTTGVFNPYHSVPHSVPQPHPSATAFDQTTYRSGSDVDTMGAARGTTMPQMRQEMGYIPSSPEARYMADSEGRNTWFSTASGSSGAPVMSSVSSSMGLYPSTQPTQNNQLRLANEGDPLPPDYESAVGLSASKAQVEKGVVLRAP